MSKIEKIQESENKLVEIQNLSEAVILQLKEENINLKTLIVVLKYEIEEVRRTNKLDSTSSSKPSSCDGKKIK